MLVILVDRMGYYTSKQAGKAAFSGLPKPNLNAGKPPSSPKNTITSYTLLAVVGVGVRLVLKVPWQRRLLVALVHQVVVYLVRYLNILDALRPRSAR